MVDNLFIFYKLIIFLNRYSNNYSGNGVKFSTFRFVSISTEVVVSDELTVSSLYNVHQNTHFFEEHYLIIEPL